MKRWLIAALFLLVVGVAPAFADYVIIIANPAAMADQPPMGPGGTPPPPPPNPQEVWLDPDVILPFAAVMYQIETIPAAEGKKWALGQPFTVVHPLLKGDRWNKSYLLRRTKLCEVYVVTNVQAPSSRFLEMEKALDTKGGKEKPAPEAVIDLAEFALKHGWLKKFAEIMDKFAADQPKHAVAVNYLKVKANLAKPAQNPAASAGRSQLLQGYKSQTSDHYIAYSASRNELAPEVTERLTRLENTFRSFYYWFAMKGVLIPIPTERQTVVVTFKDDEFRMLQEILTGTPEPALADGFIGRREGVLVLSAKRLDEQYTTIEKITTPWWTEGNDRTRVLESVDIGFSAGRTKNPYAKAEVQTAAAVLKAMENDGEMAALTHNGTRQLLFASGLLHKNVAVPEWLQFGLSSFFETPMGCPGVQVGIASTEYLPAFRDLKKHGSLGKTVFLKPVDTLHKIVTDQYFRQGQMSGDYTDVRHARAASWALTYFLAQKHLDGLQKYCKELAKMPRDLELEEDELLTAFGKAFELLDSTGKTDQKKLNNLAERWNKFIDEEKLEIQPAVNAMRYLMASKLKEIEAAEERANGTAPGTPGTPGIPFNPNNPNPGMHNPNHRPGGYNPNPYPGGRPGGYPPGARPPGVPPGGYRRP